MTKKAPSLDLLTLLGQAIDSLVLFFCGLYLATRPLIPGEAAGTGTNAVLLVFVATALLLWVMRSVVEGGFVLTRSGLEIPGLAWLLLGLVSLSAAADVYHGSLRLGFWTADLAMLWLVVQYGRSTRGSQLLLRIILASAVVATLNGLYQWQWGFTQMREQAQSEVVDTLPPEMVKIFNLRLNSDRIFSTFLLANAFGGYLILLLPVFVTLMIESRGRFWKIVHGGLVGLLAVALLLTGSKGSILALGLALAIGLALRWRRLMTRPRLVLAGGVVGGVALLGYLLLLAEVGPLGPLRKTLGDALPTPSTLAGSARVRTGYWRASAAIIKAHPLRGVGVENWSGHYHQHRAIGAGESKRAHNNYLQLGAEMGIPGLLAFLAIWIIWAVRVRRDAHAEARPAPADPVLDGVLKYHALLFVAIGIGAFIFLYTMNTSFDAPEGPKVGPDQTPFDYRPAVYIGYGLAWLLAGALIRPATSRLVRWGIAVGVGAFLLHGLVDFDLYVKGLSATAFAMVGLGAAMAASHAGVEPRVMRLPLPLQFAIALACLPPFYLLSNTWLLNTIRAEQASEEAAAHTTKKRPGMAMQRLSEAIELIPWDFRSHHELARLELQTLLNVNTYATLSSAGERSKTRMLAHFERAIALNAQYATLYFDRARGMEHYGRISRRLQNQFEARTELHKTLSAQADAALASALADYQEAVRRYPHKPEFQLRLGRMLRHLGQHEAGLAAYRAARAAHDARGLADPIRLDADQLAEIAKALK